MIPTLRRVFAPPMVLLVGLGLASSASASPLRPVVHQHLGALPIVRVDCDVHVRNQCYLQMNACFQRHSRGAYTGELRPCEAAYFRCIHRARCERGPVW